MTVFTGTRTLNSLTPDLTDNGRTITSTANTPQFGDGTTATRITHFTGEFVDKTQQWDLAANADGSPVLEIGNPNNPTYIYDTYGNADWGNGGQLDAVSGFPLVVLRNTNWKVENTVDSSAFAGNLQDVDTHTEWCTFSWNRTTHVPFFGRKNIFRNTVFGGAGSGSGLSNFGPFLGFTIDTQNVLVRDFYLGFKAEYGQPSWLRGFQWLNCGSDAHNWTTSNNTWGGTSDGAMNLQDCTTTKNKVTAGNNGWIKVWRTISGKTATANGTGVSGAIRYTMFSNGGGLTPYAETYTVNASSQANFYQTENTTIAGFTTQRNELAYYFQPGERVRISGFTNTALNGDFRVQGKPYTVGLAQGNFRDKTELWVTGKNTATEATKSITFTVLPPISSSTGVYSDYKVQIIDARVLDTIGDGAGYTFAGSRNLTQLLANNGAWAGYYERNSWKVVEIPPYPYLRQDQDFNISPFSDTPGAKVEWNTLAVNDPNITQTNPTTVASYTTSETSAKCYDYCEYLKRLPANHSFINLYTGICTKNGNTLDFGALNITIDNTVASPVVITGANSVSIKATTFTGNITTTGTVTIASGSDVIGTITAPTVNVSGAFSCEVIGTVNQATPTNLVATAKATTLVYNTNTDTSVTYATGTQIGTVRNDGTGIVTIAGGSITDYTDAQINYLDSNLTAVGITSATIYQTQSDRDTGANPGATFTTSLNFKYGSVVNGVTMQNTVYLRVVVGSVTLFAQITLVLGSNILDLGVQGQLSAINAKVTTTNENLPKVNRNVIKVSDYKKAREEFS